MAQTEVEFWHAFTGRLGELVAPNRVDTFNGAQSDYKVVASHKGKLLGNAECRHRGIPRRRTARHTHGLRGRPPPR